MAIPYTKGAAALDAAIERTRLGQRTIEDEIGASQGAVSRWVHGKSRPSLGAALGLQRLFAIDPALWDVPVAEPKRSPRKRHRNTSTTAAPARAETKRAVGA